MQPDTVNTIDRTDVVVTDSDKLAQVIAKTVDNNPSMRTPVALDARPALRPSRAACEPKGLLRGAAYEKRHPTTEIPSAAPQAENQDKESRPGHVVRGTLSRARIWHPEIGTATPKSRAAQNRLFGALAK